MQKAHIIDTNGADKVVGELVVGVAKEQRALTDLQEVWLANCWEQLRPTTKVG